MSSDTSNNLLRINNHLCYFSPNGQFLAVAFQTNVIVRDVETLNTCQLYVFPDIIEYIEWSLDSEYILCANIKKAIVQVYSIYYPQWKFKLVEGSAGLESVTWALDSRHILTLSDFNIQVSIWSLENKSVYHIQNLKSSANNKLNFSPNGSRLALIITDEGQDSVHVYKTNNWKISRKLICERLSAIDGTCWSPNGELLCIWCTFTNEPKLIIYSTKLEKNIAIFCPSKKVDPSIEMHGYRRDLIGIENVSWIPSGQLLAIVGFNEMIVLLNHATWKPLLQLYLDPIIRDNNYLNKVYKEQVLESTTSGKSSSTTHVLKECHERPINLQIGKKDEINMLSIAKVDILQFSPCGQYLAIKHQLYPTTLWIWNISADYTDYLLLENDIVAIRWNPTRAHLLVFCKCAHFFKWTPQSATCMPTPRGITVLDARWHSRGKTVAFCGYNKAIVHRMESESQ